MNNLITGIGAIIEPFLTEFCDQKLLCISTGMVIPEDIARSIFVNHTHGQQWYERFTTGRLADGKRVFIFKKNLFPEET